PPGSQLKVKKLRLWKYRSQKRQSHKEDSMFHAQVGSGFIELPAIVFPGAPQPQRLMNPYHSVEWDPIPAK
ncbi:MAG: hypothetical protein OIN88_12325, partial [Candidatus Methanoperedens sp.]|nr:hypothetical protein [Candidatus Methanoperedens sp.]